MVRQPPTRSSLLLAALLVLSFLIWSILTTQLPTVQAADARLMAPALTPTAPIAQIAAAFALLTWPGLTYGALLGLAIWAVRHRLRQLAIALILIAVAGWAITDLLRLLIHRPRPERALDLLTTYGSSYPADHLAAIVAVCIGVGAAFAVTRQSVWAKAAWQLGSLGLVLAVAVDQWLVSAHYWSDIIGGALLGGAVASVGLLIAGVSVPVPHEIVTEYVRTRRVEPSDRRCAVIYNPAKVTDWAAFRRRVEYEVVKRGWQRPLWLETTPDDPGRTMTAQAVAERVDLVLGAGGDGTVRVICDGLAGTRIPFGLIPAGTGNLLARNIGIPLDEAAALDVAFDGLDKPIDLVRLSVDGGPGEHFAVIAGIGLDAVIMESTRPELKKAVGSAAYFVAAAQNANHPALPVTVQMDDRPPFRRRAHVIVIGNVGILQANIQLIPGARADDGLLDLLVASPRSLADWVRLTTKVVTRQRPNDSQLDRLTGRRVTITADRREGYQLDGDTVGQCRTMTAEVVPGALVLRVPRDSRRVVGLTTSGVEQTPLELTPGPTVDGAPEAVQQPRRRRVSHASASA
jgi:diacylglycerol kinase family enzyme